MKFQLSSDNKLLFHNDENPFLYQKTATIGITDFLSQTLKIDSFKLIDVDKNVSI